MKLPLLLLISFTLFIGRLEAQVPGRATDEAWRYRIQAVRVEGNQQTAERYILRELTFSVNDTLSLEELDNQLNESRINLINTALFINHRIELYYKTVSRSEVVVMVMVEERWYFWPEPILETADHNFNRWILDPDLKRLNYGVNLIRENLRGFNERLSIVLRLGADEKYEVRWSDPAVFHSRKMGMGIGLGFEGNHAVPAALVDNRLMVLQGERYLIRKTYGYLHLTYRPSLKVIHLAGIQITGYQADSTLLNFNPAFLPAHQTVVSELIYWMKADYRNHKAYPLWGSYLDLELRPAWWYAGYEKGSPRVTAKFNGRYYIPLKNRWYHATGLTLGMVAGRVTPFPVALGLGYGREFVRGFEYDVIQGNFYTLIKQNLKFALIPEKAVRVPFAPHPKFTNGSVALYFNFILDGGFVAGEPSNGNDLVNKAMGGAGVGVDLVTYYDKVARIEAMINSRGRAGIYFHFISPI